MKMIWKMPTEKFQNDCGARVTGCSSLGNCSFSNLAGVLHAGLSDVLCMFCRLLCLLGLGQTPGLLDGFPTAVVIYGVMDALDK